jgi:type II secretory ATPase GspE/PulE/Tfp pilus assembly ATPase PilB-like protein
LDISDKVKEAETYRSMGLLEESILIYEEILSSENAIEDTTRDRFESTVAYIREELETLENGEEDTVTAEEIAIIKDTLSLTDEMPHILESASAFMELGQHKHALAEYEKLLVKEYAWKDFVQDMATCLLKCFRPPVILQTVKKMVSKSEIGYQDKAEILFRLGLEMQKRDLQVIAQELCCSAGEFDPDSEEIEKWLDSNGLRQQRISKHDQLVIHNKKTSRQTEFEETNAQQGDLDESIIIEISIEYAEEEQIEAESTDDSFNEVERLVDQVIVSAFRQNVSDIHFEPSPESQCVNILFRIDGSRHDFSKVPLSMARGIMSRIKIMANLDVAERRLPQNGKIKFRQEGTPTVELRVETIPITGGYEDAVLRIQAKVDALALDGIGLSEKNLKTLKGITSKPCGLFLVVGPAGSGKATTLHSALGNINKPGIKIWTAEDPVKITQPHLRQVEAKPGMGLDFSRIMRSFLRADPDVIMIGEMRDQETAATALEASLTGHLVFSTLHANHSAETIARLLDMGLNPNNIADALLGVLAQRLVQRLCPNCKTAKHLSEDEIEEIIMEYGNDHFSSSGIEINPDLEIFQPNGCDKCSNTGYSGRVAIHEMLENTDEIKELIKNKEVADTITNAALTLGMKTLKQDGILKVFDGLTDFSEVRRVCIK